jgi:chromate transport protein ChrA
MYRDLVERRHWIAESDYKEGMALAQLMPGPLAAQFAIYLGYVHYRLFGTTLVGLAFVLPSFVMVVAIGAVYASYGGIEWMQAVFYGVGAAVIGIIAMSAYKLTTKNIGKDRLLWAIFLVSAAVTVITKFEVVWIFLGAGLLAWMVRAPPKIRFGGTMHSVAAGFWGAVVAAAGTFIPCYLFTVLPAPYFKKYGKRPGIVAFVEGVTAAAIGAITGAVIVIGVRSITDWSTAGLAVITIAVLWRFKKLPEPVVVAAAALIGLVIYPVVKHA